MAEPLARFCILHRNVRVEEQQDARPFAVERVGVEPVVFVDGPEIPLADLGSVVGLTEKWPDTVDGFAFAAREHDERPGRPPFVEPFLPIYCVSDAKRPEVGCRIALWRTQVTVERKQCLLMRRIVRAESRVLIQK